MKEFPNGFASWQETHFLVVEAIAIDCVEGDASNTITEILESQGHTGLFVFAEQLTDEFEKENEGREWDGEFLEAVWDFMEKKLV